jgi:asparagine synthetase B (glutamine-hydrolysing)
MAGYFITNKRESLSDVATIFDKKNLVKRETREADSFSIVSCVKRNVAACHNVYESKDDFIIGFGAYSYQGHFGEDALKLILEEFRTGREPFSNILGHFNFIIFSKGTLFLITDKTGFYHSYIYNKNNHVYISNSVFAIAKTAPSLTVNKQAILEFINIQTIFGGESLFEEISHVPAGVIYDVKSGKHKKYYDNSDAAVDFEAFVDRLSSYFECFRNLDYIVSSDLSGGYDSRTVASVIEANGLDIHYNTNVNSEDCRDHQIANEIALRLNKPITTFGSDFCAGEFPALVEETFTQLELARDVFRAAVTSRLFSAKSNLFDIVIGGYGGALYRDSHSEPLELPALVRKNYADRWLKIDERDSRFYIDNLISKFSKTLSQLDEKDLKKSNEKIHFFEKMRYWGGARITAFNQYCFRLHPLLDHALAKHIFDIPLHEKQGAQFQKRLIARICPDMARIRSMYFGRNVLPESEKTAWERLIEKPTVTKQRAVKRLYDALQNTKLLQTEPHLKNAVEAFLKHKGRLRRSVPKYLDVYTPASFKIADIVSIELSESTPRHILGRCLAVEKALQQFV